MTRDEAFEEIPGRIDVALAIPIRDGKLLVAQRRQGVHLAGYWEFPGGKIGYGEDPVGAAARELIEETGLRARELEPLILLVHDYADRPLRFHVFLAREPDGELSGDEPRWVWKTLPELEELRMPEANRQMLRALRSRA